MSRGLSRAVEGQRVWKRLERGERVKMTRFPVLLTVAVVFAGVCLRDATAAKTEDPVRVSVSAGAEWTDNRDSAADGEDNTSLFISPRLDVVTTTERTMFDFFYALSYSYRTDPGEDQDDSDFYHDIGLHVASKISPILKLILSEAFSRTLDPAMDESGTTLRRDSNYYINRAEAGGDYDVSERVSVTVRARHMMKGYDDSEIADQYDENSIGGSFGLWFQAQRSLGLQLIADGTAHSYEKGVYDVDRDSTSVYGAVGVDKAFTKNLRGSCRAGYKQIDYSDDSIKSQGEPFVRVAIEGWTVPSARVKLGVTYELKDADEYPFATELFTGVDGRFELDLNQTISLAAAVYYWMADYESDSIPAGYALQLATDLAWQNYVAENGIQVGGDKVTAVAALEATVRLPGQTAIKITQRLEDVSSDVSQDFTRNATSLAITKQF
jgi:hypothetical protein